MQCNDKTCGVVCHMCGNETTTEEVTAGRLARIGGSGVVHWYHIGCLLRHWFDHCTRPECVAFCLNNRTPGIGVGVNYGTLTLGH